MTTTLTDETFNQWWDAGKQTADNPFTEGSAAYWALEGWRAAHEAKQAGEAVMFAWRRDDGSYYDASCTEHSAGMHPLYAHPPKAEKAPDVSVQWLAEMVMSDCGCSTNNQRLLERITERIEQHIRANTPAKAEKAQDFDAARGKA